MMPGTAGLFFLLTRNRLKTAAVLIKCGQDETDTQLHAGLEILQAGDTADPSYQAAPSFAYLIGDYTLDRTGTLAGPKNDYLIRTLLDDGYQTK